MIFSTIHETGFISLSFGPKFQPPEYFELYFQIFSVNSKYPLNGSSTYCQGRTAFALRILIGFLSSILLIISGTRRFSAQSPPPIAFPARTEATAIPCSS